MTVRDGWRCQPSAPAGVRVNKGATAALPARQAWYLRMVVHAAGLALLPTNELRMGAGGRRTLARHPLPIC